MEDTLEKLRNAGDLWVVLKNRFGNQYTESYYLPNVLLIGDKFWGKFRQVHTADRLKSIDNSQVVSYAYNNFSDIVSTSCMNQKLERYYSSFAYSYLKFQVKDNYRKVWDSNTKGDISGISEAVHGCKRLKLSVYSKDGYNYILPCHTVEVYDESGTFTIETEFDGYPNRLRNVSDIAQLDEIFKEGQTQVEFDSNQPTYVATHFAPCTIFYTSFVVTVANDLIHRYVVGDQVSRVQFDYEKFEVWSEC